MTIIVKDERGNRWSSHGLVDEISIPSGMEKYISVELTETLHLGKLTKMLRNKVIKGVKTGIMDSRGGAAAVAYRALCTVYALPTNRVYAGNVHIECEDTALLETIVAKNLMMKNVRGSNGRGYQPPNSTYGELRLNAPTVVSTITPIRMPFIAGYNCGIKRDEAAAIMQEYHDKTYAGGINLALNAIQNNETLVYKSVIGAVE